MAGRIEFSFNPAESNDSIINTITILKSVEYLQSPTLKLLKYTHVSIYWIKLE